MRNLSKLLARSVSIGVLTICLAQGAAASQRDDRGDKWFDGFTRLRHIIVTILDELSVPKG